MISLCKGQNVTSGVITGSETKLPVPFAMVGVIGKNTGTIANEKGEFTLTCARLSNTDSIKVGSIGFVSKTFLANDFFKEKIIQVSLTEQATQLQTVEVKAGKIKNKILGTTKYTKNNCTGFVDIEGNWKGSEAAILLKNNKNVLLENFSFFIIQNKYTDSLIFRLNFYKRISPPEGSPSWWGNDWVGPSILRKSIVFKVGVKQGEFTLPIKEYNITTGSDFFVSLECLVDEMDIKKFCYSGSTDVKSFYKIKAFSKWHRTGGKTGGGGADFNVKVSYSK